MIAFWIWTIHTSTKWLRYAHGLDTAGPTEVNSLAKGPMNPAAYILVVLVLFFFWIAGNAYYNALPSVRLGRADQELKAIPLYRTISEADPQTYQRMLTATVQGMEKDEGVDAMVTRISPILSGTLSKYAPNASDESVITMIDVVIRKVELLHNAQSDTCYYSLFPNKNGAPPLSSYSDDKTRQDSLAAMNSIVQSAVHSPQPSPDTAKAKKLLIPVNERLRKAYGDYLPLLTNKPVDSAGRQKVCDISVALYREIESFPKREDASLLLRYLLSDQTQAK